MFETFETHADKAPVGWQGSELSIIVPTFNERNNVSLLVEKVSAALPQGGWEIVFVDDNSPDDTSKAVRSIAQRDARVRCIQRIDRRGLSSACIEGFLSTSAPYIAVMDADLQHDERILAAMLSLVKDEGNDLAIGSRYAEGGGFGSWEEKRVKKSQFATRLSSFVTHADMSDPMSGFFLMKREVFEAAQPRLSKIGFKILLDIFVSCPYQLKFAEVPYEFRERVNGESKLDSTVMWEFAMLLADKKTGIFYRFGF